MGLKARALRACSSCSSYASRSYRTHSPKFQTCWKLWGCKSCQEERKEVTLWMRHFVSPSGFTQMNVWVHDLRKDVRQRSNSPCSGLWTSFRRNLANMNTGSSMWLARAITWVDWNRISCTWFYLALIDTMFAMSFDTHQSVLSFVWLGLRWHGNSRTHPAYRYESVWYVSSHFDWTAHFLNLDCQAGTCADSCWPAVFWFKPWEPSTSDLSHDCKWDCVVRGADSSRQPASESGGQLWGQTLTIERKLLLRSIKVFLCWWPVKLRIHARCKIHERAMSESLEKNLAGHRQVMAGLERRHK